MGATNAPPESRQLSPLVSQKVQLVRQQYGTVMQFLTKMSPSEQINAGRYPDRAFFGKAPTLAIINKTYGDGTAATWLIAQLHDLCEFTNSRGKLDERQMTMLAEIIANEYDFLKASELLLFFYKFKAGKYGRFYGTVDPLIIEDALEEFCTEREHKIRIKQAEDEKRAEAAKAGPRITLQEYLKSRGLPQFDNFLEAAHYVWECEEFTKAISSALDTACVAMQAIAK